jgi:RNA polymerase sigma factor (sigma-70 family)
MTAFTGSSPDWLEHLKAMDEDAWDELLTLYASDLHEDILASLNKRGLPTRHADDIQQQTWVTVIQRIEEFDCLNGYDFYNWVRVISLNHIRNFSRKKRAATSLDAIDDQSEETGVTLDSVLYLNASYKEDNPETQIVLSEQIAAIVNVIDMFKTYQKEIFIRCVLLGEKPAYVSKDFDQLKPRSISQLLTRMKKVVRAECDNMM